MTTKKLISYFLILVMSIQILPCQCIAAWLSSGQLTEEIGHDVDSAKSQFGKDAVLLHPWHNADSQGLSTSVFHNWQRDESLFIRHADEILSPPPNV
jgi:hypothetical protein